MVVYGKKFSRDAENRTRAIRLRPTNVSQTFGKKQSRGNRNRTDVLPTPWAYTTPILYPDSVFYPHAYTLPLCYTPRNRREYTIVDLW